MKSINYLTLLLISAVLLFIMFFGKIYTAYTPFLVLLVITFGINLINLFLINHKNLQLRLCIYNTIVLIAFQVWIIIVFHQLKVSLVKFPVSMVFPIIAAILTIIAIGLLRRNIAAEGLMKVLKKNRKNKKF